MVFAVYVDDVFLHDAGSSKLSVIEAEYSPDLGHPATMVLPSIRTHATRWPKLYVLVISAFLTLILTMPKLVLMYASSPSMSMPLMVLSSTVIYEARSGRFSVRPSLESRSMFWFEYATTSFFAELHHSMKLMPVSLSVCILSYTVTE